MKELARGRTVRWDVPVEGWLLLALVVAYAAAAVWVGRATPMWFDELITMFAAHEPTWREMFLAERADGNPPLVFVLTRLSLGVFGTNEFALRLPALCGMVTAIVCCYRFVERRCGGASGLLAAAMVVCSGAAVYGYEGRPYGVVMGLTALLLVLWQRATERREGDVSALVAVGAATFGLVIAHPFGVLYALAPVAVGEGVRWWRERRVDGGMVAALVWGASGLAITLPLSVVNRRILLAAAGHEPAVAYPGVAMLRAAKHLALGGLPWVVLLPLCAVSVWALANFCETRWEDVAQEGSASAGVGCGGDVDCDGAGYVATGAMRDALLLSEVHDGGGVGRVDAGGDGVFAGAVSAMGVAGGGAGNGRGA